jgi:uncharacterized protein (DUF427 family)
MAVFQPPPPSVEPTRRRIRVRLADHVVADSTRALLYAGFGPGGGPTYYLPLEDVRPGVLVDETETGWSVVAGGRRAEGGARTSDEFPELKGHVTFSWEALDWWEEDEQVYIHAKPTDHRVDALRSSRHIEVLINGEKVADTIRPVALFETHLPTRWYLPSADVRLDLLTASETVTRCPYKGTARYFSHRDLPDAAWSYPDPIPENPKIKDLVCFFTERVDLLVDGVAQPRTVSPWSDGTADTIDHAADR